MSSRQSPYVPVRLKNISHRSVIVNDFLPERTVDNSRGSNSLSAHSLWLCRRSWSEALGTNPQLGTAQWNIKSCI